MQSQNIFLKSYIVLYAIIKFNFVSNDSEAIDPLYMCDIAKNAPCFIADSGYEEQVMHILI